MTVRLAALSLCFLTASAVAVETQVTFREAPHKYLDHTPQDRFAAVQKQIEKGEVKLDTSSDKAFLASILKALDIPVSSQLLVFSASSLQSEIINPSNPRALYFNEDTYIGYVPGGKVEVIAMDPEMGAMFYIFERLRPGGGVPPMTRSDKCFNCHAGNATRRVPGLIAESLLPMLSGASLETYRRDEQGHQIPLEKRFGGWHLTGKHHLKDNLANLMGRTSSSRGFEKTPVEPGQMSDLNLHLIPTSDILPHLVHEHQLGFENRVFHAAYVMRQLLAEGRGSLPLAAKPEMETLADELARYILFADEAKLPTEGIEGDAEFIREFQRNKKSVKAGASLKDFDLKNRIFKYRCSYMIYTDSWQKLPAMLRERVYFKMAEGLREQNANPAYAHLPPDERRAIRTILKETLPGLPTWWR
ncbi:hypothetical protein EI77_04717 [Prosthecobacter fusiformis]|uniref:Cytochrome c domain-containing protein n=1 Tax=Prosthecobacter fusiformis TaxID=48464 RepID=A0A4R7RJ92_9BACT|nr:hypothetical protein [Prosthecobacter fusiformis]TDU62449.1 hypothetical protein EI77_04717 [Prosthecobacter fusiformis]